MVMLKTGSGAGKNLTFLQTGLELEGSGGLGDLDGGPPPILAPDPPILTPDPLILTPDQLTDSLADLETNEDATGRPTNGSLLDTRCGCKKLKIYLQC
jgi:hypothetical protein